VIKIAENLEDKYRATIVYPAAQNIAHNSKKLPRSGLGAEAVVVACTLNHIAPHTANSEPAINCFVIISFKKYPAAIAVIIGISDVIIPACDADVYSKALASKIKYKHGSKKAKRTINLMSFFVKLYFVKLLMKYTKHKDAISIRKNITVNSPKSTIADFKAIKELPHINIAKIIDTNPTRLKFCDFVKLHLFLIRREYTLLKYYVKRFL